ncbi:MAG TPA: hypothetical protein VLF14_03185 [Candidatus Binatia bacterium]|nr:hypothetical protein [Candidatus Binatia bacterium]
MKMTTTGYRLRATGMAIGATLVGLLLHGACGLKSDPRGADQVRPKTISNLTAQLADDGVHLAWQRPATYMNGQRMDDLGGFLVFRGLRGQEAQQIGEIPVADRERFRPEKRFEYVDKQVAKGETVYYRVITFTTDKYYSFPSNQVTVTLQP